MNRLEVLRCFRWNGFHEFEFATVQKSTRKRRNPFRDLCKSGVFKIWPVVRATVGEKLSAGDAKFWSGFIVHRLVTSV